MRRRPRPGLGDEMRQLMAEGALHLAGRDFDELRIEDDLLRAIAGEARRRAHARIPRNGDDLRETAATQLPDEHAGDLLEDRIAAQPGGRTARRASGLAVARQKIDLPQQVAAEIKTSWRGERLMFRESGFGVQEHG